MNMWLKFVEKSFQFVKSQKKHLCLLEPDHVDWPWIDFQSETLVGLYFMNEIHQALLVFCFAKTDIMLSSKWRKFLQILK